MARDEKYNNWNDKLQYWWNSKIDTVEEEWVNQKKRLKNLARR